MFDSIKPELGIFHYLAHSDIGNVLQSQGWNKIKYQSNKQLDMGYDQGEKWDPEIFGTIFTFWKETGKRINGGEHNNKKHDISPIGVDNLNSSIHFSWFLKFFKDRIYITTIRNFINKFHIIHQPQLLKQIPLKAYFTPQIILSAN